MGRSVEEEEAPPTLVVRGTATADIPPPLTVATGSFIAFNTSWPVDLLSAVKVGASQVRV
jgi:hypothetical protein